jgi:GNAT superfamily N-acetyltransferase
MPDLLVRLYDLPETDLAAMEAQGITLRRAIAPERRIVADWVATHFYPHWAAECEMAMSGHPVSVWIAIRGGDLLGFACADATARGFFGPTGVLGAERGKGIGEALLFAALRGLRELGYAYAIIGGAGPVEFYRKRLDAIEIPGSAPGIYRGMLRVK